MDTKKIVIALGIVVLLIIIFSYSAKASVVPVGNGNLPTDDTPNPNNVFVDVQTSAVGKKAYNKYANYATIYTLNFNSLESTTSEQGALLGTITGEKMLKGGTDEYFYVLDEKYLVSTESVTVS